MTSNNVLLLGWNAKGLRGYLRDAKIALKPDKYRHVLVQMPNGTGKTTTMALLRSALTGQLDPSLSISSLQADRTTKEGHFELHLSVYGERLSIRLECDFEMGRHYFYTTTVEAGRQNGHLLSTVDPALADALERSIELFVFDGELAQNMLKDGAAAADRAIEALYKTDAFEDLVNKIGVLKENRKKLNKDITTASEQSAVNRLEREYEEAKEILAKLTQEKDGLDRSLAKIDRRTAEITDRLEELGLEDQAFKNRQKDIEDRDQKARNDISRFATEAVSSFRLPLSLHSRVGERLTTLNNTLETRRLPRSSKSFFEELATKKNCICGEEIDEAKRKYILSHADDHLGDEQVQVINDIKYKLKDGFDRRWFSAVVNDLSEAEDRLTSIAQERARLDIEKAEAGMEEVERLTSEREALQAEQARKSQALQFLTEVPISIHEADWKRNLPACKEEEGKRRKAFEMASGNNRYFTAADKLIRATQRARKLAKERLQVFVKDRTNSQLEKILDSEIIRVSRIDGRLHLVNEENLPKDSASEGQKLAVCYAFLTALLAEAPARLPFIVDSPAVSLDLVLRQNVGALIPKIFDQLIVFVISSEREGFADSFEKRTDTQFVTASINQADGSVLIDESKSTFFQFQSGAVSS
ncbi:hypothetical protein [uncultured Roseobacter sp.]|uniref:hypothetical protein n=1 Tax=uncultured Roseobacter sp. TaxID=114847 RepID=UPI00261ABE49|nr:hypothetical protein [uncultured Roseobacter sp.]